MKIEQIYTGCLAQGTYYIVSGKEAAVIDPLREIQPYINKAEKDGVRIKYIFETHFHADFVSGHIDLARATGATIVYGPTARPAFDAHIAKDGEIFRLGDISFKVLHTPGHTLESSCFLLQDEKGNDHAIFTGDTLFIGDVGRPDLAQKAANMTQEELAGLLFDSLRSKVMTLGDEVIVYPAHGAGSACGKNMSKETWSTIGEQKRSNYALRPDTNKETFIAEVTEGLLPPPVYFPMNARMNKEGYDNIDDVINRSTMPLTPAAFEAAAGETGALILDTRDPEVFVKGFIPNSINIGLDGMFAPWVGALVPDIKQPILLVTDKGSEKEAIIRLARVGYDHTIGFLEGGFEAWQAAGKETDSITTINATGFAELNRHMALHIVDVRRATEFAYGHVPGAANLPLDYINDNMASLPGTDNIYIYCAGGYRSVIAASILKARGFRNIVNIAGGYAALRKAGVVSEIPQH